MARVFAGSSMRRTISPLILLVTGLAAVTLPTTRSAAADDNSSFTSQSVPTFARAGARVTVSLTFRNTGTASWTFSGGYILSSPDPANSANWQVSSVALPSPVEAGSSVTFTFRVTAPITPGTYDFHWQLAHGTRFFGATSTNVAIKVIAPDSSASPFRQLFTLLTASAESVPPRVNKTSNLQESRQTLDYSKQAGVTKFNFD